MVLFPSLAQRSPDVVKLAAQTTIFVCYPLISIVLPWWESLLASNKHCPQWKLKKDTPIRENNENALPQPSGSITGDPLISATASTSSGRRGRQCRACNASDHIGMIFCIIAFSLSLNVFIASSRVCLNWKPKGERGKGRQLVDLSDSAVEKFWWSVIIHQIHAINFSLLILSFVDSSIFFLLHCIHCDSYLIRDTHLRASTGLEGMSRMPHNLCT